MSESEVFRICPHCGSREVPRLILRSAQTRGDGSRWECRACHLDWSDADDNHRWASPGHPAQTHGIPVRSKGLAQMTRVGERRTARRRPE
jgi:predicted RNA-binding Zn-ribbon protein involved in translation (DUF1610 family)